MCLFAMGCTNELKFEQKKFGTQITSKDGEVTAVSIDIPVASSASVASDSINKAVFAAMKEIVYVGEAPFNATDFDGLVGDFISCYKEIKKANETEPGWSAKIDGKIIYTSDALINIELTHYSFTGGAHGYGGKRSLLFDVETGKVISNDKLFKNQLEFKKMAESKFRAKYNIGAKTVINATDFMFENNEFQLPQTYFYTKEGFLLYYNVYEIASYAQGNFEVLIPYTEMKPYLKAI